MSKPHEIVVGTSEPQDFALIDRGDPVIGTDIPDIELLISRYESGVATPLADPPTVAWLNASAGTVRVTGVETLAVGTYLVRFKLTDSGAKVGFIPTSARSDVWQVVPVANR